MLILEVRMRSMRVALYGILRVLQNYKAIDTNYDLLLHISRLELIKIFLGDDGSQYQKLHLNLIYSNPTYGPH